MLSGTCHRHTLIDLKRILNAKMNRDVTWTILRIQLNQALYEASLILLKFVALLTENIVRTLFSRPYRFKPFSRRR